MKIGTIQAIGCAGLGMMLGFLAAARDFSTSTKADEARPAAERAAVAGPGLEGPSCCPAGPAGNRLLARAEPDPAAAQVKAAPTSSGKKPNILVIMGDDVGIWNIGAYHRGMMAGKTPNIDRIAAEGMLFTDYYAEASCTAGRAAFVTGELPIRTGMTTVGQAGATLGLPAEAATIATVLKSMGYATG